jgi:hypothetical protein
MIEKVNHRLASANQEKIKLKLTGSVCIWCVVWSSQIVLLISAAGHARHLNSPSLGYGKTAFGVDYARYGTV